MTSIRYRIAASMFLLASCASDTRSGTTACGEGYCEAGQYCNDTQLCITGCLSDVHCAADQYCEMQPFSRCVSRTPDEGVSRQPYPCEVIAQQLLDCESIDNVEFSELRSSCDQSLINCVMSTFDCAEKEQCLPTPCVFDAECDATRGDLRHEICDGGLCVLGCREDLDCGEFSRCESRFDECFPD